MATIQKRGNSYTIKVSCGYDSKGKQFIQSMTWKPEPKMTAKQIEKEVNRQAVLFEEACDCYDRAYRLNQRGESLRECLMCYLLRQDEEGFVRVAEANRIDEMGQLEISNELSLAAKSDEAQALLSRLKVLGGKLEGPERNEAKKAIHDLIFKWKEAYRRSCRV